MRGTRKAGSGTMRTAAVVTALAAVAAVALGAEGWMTSGGGTARHESDVDDQESPVSDEVSPAHEPVAAQETIDVPLTLSAGRLAVPVSAQDRGELTFFVSTGSAVTVLTESAARRVGETRELRLGGVEIPLEGARTVSDGQLSWGGVGFDGIVGVNTLNHFDVLFDVPGGRMLLRDPGPSTDWPGTALGDPARIRVYHGVVIGLDVQIDGREYAAMLDLGTPGLVVSGDVALADEDATVSLDVGTGEALEAPVRIGDIPMLDRWDPNGAGFALVGAVIARDCALSLSWVHREIRRCVR